MYDIIVIGAGSGGLNIAGFMNTVGFKVLLIEKKDSSIGGDCLNFGCVPSKALIHVSKLVHNSKLSQNFGSGSFNLNMKNIKKYIENKKNIIRKHENASYFREKGMKIELGTASFVNKNTVRVGNSFFSAKKIIIATGSRPNIPKIKGLDYVNYLTNETIFSVEKLPKHLLIIGGGPIGVELGQAFKRLGSEVTLIQRGPQFLPKEEKDVSEILLSKLQKEGMNFLFNTSPKEFTDKKTLLAENKNGKKYRVKFDALLISAGRKLNVENLGLEKAGIKVKDGKLIVNKYLQTTNKNVFAVGDVAGSYQFTHAAELHAGVVLSNFFSPFKKKLNNDHLSWVTFTSPEIATFGLNETELIKRKEKYEVLKMSFEDSDRHIVEETTEGMIKLYVHKDKILGGTMVGENAGEIFQELVLANSAGIPMKKLFNKIYPYPTASRVNKAVISQHYKKKLSPFVKRVLRWLY